MKIKNSYIAVGLYIISLLKCLLASGVGFSLLDEGEYLHIGLRILRGDVPYKDFFSYLPPLYNYWNVIAFELFGPDVYSPRLLNSFVFSLVPVISYFLCLRFTNAKFAIISPLVIIFMELNMERLYYHTFTFAALLTIFLFIKNKNYYYGIISGLLFGIASLFRLDIAFEFLAGSLLGLLMLNLTTTRQIFNKITLIHIVSVFVGVAIPLLVLIFWLVKNNSINQFIRNVFGTPALMTVTYSLPFPLPWNIIPKSLDPKSLFSSYEAFFAYVILITYLLVSIYLIKNWRSTWLKTPEIPTLLFIGFFTAPYMFGRTDLGHLIKGGLPAILLMPFVVDKFALLNTKFKNIFILVPIVLIIVGLGQLYWWSRFFDTKLVTPNGEIIVNSNWPQDTIIVSSETLDKSLKFIANNSNDSDQILVLPYMAGLYYLSDRPSKLYAGNVFYSYLPNEDEFVRQMADLNIKIVIYDSENGPKGQLKKFKEYYPKIDKYIMTNYLVYEKTKEGWLLMHKK